MKNIHAYSLHLLTFVYILSFRCSNSNRECQITDSRATGIEKVSTPSHLWWVQISIFLLGKFLGILQKQKFYPCVSWCLFFGLILFRFWHSCIHCIHRWFFIWLMEFTSNLIWHFSHMLDLIYWWLRETFKV